MLNASQAPRATGHPPEPMRSRLERRRPSLVAILSTCFVLALALWPSALAAARGWWPLEDDARTAVRVMDLLQGHPPMTGAQASTGQVDPLLSAHHLGPVEFYALAPFVAVHSRVGLLVGMAVLHGVALLAVARAAWRLGGNLLMVPVLMGCAVLALQLDYAKVFQPVNTVPPVFALVLLPLAGALVIRRQPQWIPVLVVAATVVVQGQLAYVPVTIAILCGVSAVGLHDWHDNRGRLWPVPGWPHRPAPRWRPGWVAVGLASLLWFPPLWESLTFRPSNLGQLWRYVLASDARAPVGPRPGVLDYVGDLVGDHVSESYALGLALLFTTALLALSWRVGSRSPLRRTPEPRWRDPAYLVPGIVVGAFAFEALLLAGTLPTGPGVWTTAYWVTPLRAFRVLAWACAAWLALRWLRGWLRTRADDRAIRWVGLAAAVIGLASTLLLVLPSSADFDVTKNRVVTTPGSQVLPALREVANGGDPVRVMYPGGFWYTPVYPTAYRLMGEGYLVCNDFTWPLPQETDYRAWSSCPASSPVVVISRAGEPLQVPADLADATVTRIGTSSTYNEGEIRVAYDTYLLTFPTLTG